MSRYIVIGCTGAGKSTLARRISQLCAIPYTDIDALYWRDDWTLCSDEEVVSALPLDSDSWVFDGNFVGHRDQVWSKASAIIWVDPPRGIALYRLIKRNFSWWLFRRPTWTRTRMPFKIALSGIIHGFRRSVNIQSQFPACLADCSEKRIYHIQSGSDQQAFLDSLQTQG